MPRPVVILSNRGPLAFERGDGGRLEARRGAGGLVSGLAPLVSGTETTWIAAALSEDDRAAATDGLVEAEGLRVRFVDVDDTTFRAHYDVVCNSTLWFAYHGLFDLVRRPRIDRRWRQAWSAYREVNDAFAAAAAEVAPEGAAVLVQDYHLALVAPMLLARRPDLATVHFSHTPFCPPDGLRVLPDTVAVELLEGMAANRACTFHSGRWAGNFADTCRRYLDCDPVTRVTPLVPDPHDVIDVARSDTCAAEAERLDDLIGDRQMILRVDRVELSKNLLRGFHAYDDLFVRHPEWLGKVVFVAFVYPSREGLPEYLAYRQEAETLIERVNRRWGTDDWTPIVYDPDDDFPRSVAALRRYDLLLVNPIRDGLNFVAIEGVYVNDRDGVLALSTEAGAWDLLGNEGALSVNPFDVEATTEAMATALGMDRDERRRRAALLRAAATRTPADWLAEQLDAAG
ncbi:MAG: alpha,alpha-trehalose-phosphate synthase (UDP-forming) [Acidimicrobiales bacterium]